MYNIAKKSHTIDLTSCVPLVNIDDLYVELLLSLSVHTMAQRGLPSQRLGRLDCPGREAMQSLPLPCVSVHVLVTLEKQD